LYGQKANYVSSITISSATSRLEVTRTQTSFFVKLNPILR
jgi:hypothetical protein